LALQKFEQLDSDNLQQNEFTHFVNNMLEIIGEVFESKSFTFLKCFHCHRKQCACKDSYQIQETLTKFSCLLKLNLLECSIIGQKIPPGLYILSFTKNTLHTNKIFVSRARKVFEDVEEIDYGLDARFMNDFKGLLVNENSNSSVCNDNCGTTDRSRSARINDLRMLQDITNSTQDAIDGLDLLAESQ
jgi:hypothetical protein